VQEKKKEHLFCSQRLSCRERPTGFADYPASYKLGIAVSERGAKLATYHHLVPTIKMSDTILPLFIYIHDVQSDRLFTLNVAVFESVG
jgi:hypothetical protein